MLLAGIISACAQPGRPSGGPKDVTPPNALISVPSDGSTNWRGSRIELLFDEYIKLVQPNQQIFISPPTEQALEYEVRGKRLSIDIPNSLLENTTYVIQFGSAVADLNEGNPKRDFNFVFSTGPNIDSLILKGSVRDAVLNEVPEGFRVHLYPSDSTFTDSVPATSLPRYVGNVREDGHFTISNIREGKYRVLGLVDGNSNYKYDLPNEVIALYEEIHINPKDTPEIQLYAFEPNPPLKIKSARLKEPRLLQWAFSRPVDTLIVRPEVGTYVQLSTKRDSAWIFMSDTIRDTLILEVELRAEADLALRDTITLSPRAGSERDFKITRTNVRQQRLPRDGQIEIEVNTPLQSADSIWLYSEADTQKLAIRGTVYSAYVDVAWRYGLKGELVLWPGCLVDYRGRTIDTTRIGITVREEVDYAALILDFEGKDSAAHYVIQLLNNAGTIIEESRVSGDSILEWQRLYPERLQLRVLEDLNANGKWDPGDYWLKRDTEVYYYFDSPVELKPNWEMEYRWSLKNE